MVGAAEAGVRGQRHVEGLRMLARAARRPVDSRVEPRIVSLM
jgi:hypothetical protein